MRLVDTFSLGCGRHLSILAAFSSRPSAPPPSSSSIHSKGPQDHPPSSEYGAYSTAKARYLPWLSRRRLHNISSSSPFARKQSTAALQPNESTGHEMRAAPEHLCRLLVEAFWPLLPLVLFFLLLLLFSVLCRAERESACVCVCV